MAIYDKIMEGEKSGIGDYLDSRMHDKDISKHFKKKYGMSFYSASALLYAGELPGHERLTSSEISNIINEGTDKKVAPKFFTGGIAKRVIKEYGIEDWPVFHGGGAVNRGSLDRDIGECIECRKKFKIDKVNHPANLCICTECAPNGAMYGGALSTSGRHNRGLKSRS